MIVKLTDELAEYLMGEDWNCLMVKEVPGHGVCGVVKYLYTYGIQSQMDGNIYGHLYYGRWCYPNPNMAMSALAHWDGVGDPPGDWIKYKGKDGERYPPGYKEPWE